MRKYLSLISLILLIMFIVLFFVFPQALSPLPESWDIVLVILLLLGSFITALFSIKGRLKVITLVVSTIGILGLGVVIIFSIAMMIFGNFGS